MVEKVVLKGRETKTRPAPDMLSTAGQGRGRDSQDL